jgi:hypothetical protein
MADKNEKITDATKEAERRDGKAQHGAPQVPTADEAAAADRIGGASEQTKESYEEYLDTAKDAKGEGRIP